MKIATTAVLVAGLAAMANAQITTKAKTKFFSFCARPIMDAVAAVPLPPPSVGFTTLSGAPNPGPPLNPGFLGALASGHFAFRTPMVSCDDMRAGRVNAATGAREIGTLFGTCDAVTPYTVNMTAGIAASLPALQAITYYCTWNANFVSSSTRKKLEPTLAYGSFVRTALTDGATHVISKAGYLAKSLISVTTTTTVTNPATFTGFTEFAVNYIKGSGWNPYRA